MGRFVYNSTVSAIDPATGRVYPLSNETGCPRVTPAMIGGAVEDDQCVYDITPASSDAQSRQAAADYLVQSGGQSVSDVRRLFGVTPNVPTKTETSSAPSVNDVQKLMNQLGTTGLQIYGATQGQRPTGTGPDRFQSRPGSNMTGLLVAGAAVGLGLVAAVAITSRKGSTQAKVQEGVKTVATGVSNGMRGKFKAKQVAIVAAGLALAYTAWKRGASFKSTMADLQDLQDEADWLAWGGDGYSGNLVGGGEW